ncbi:MAG: sodium:proton antiporter, partial [Nitrospinaceae bacterium]|nr:sodium:proton antiporter [Nitrospinaceae bacterium]NIR57268.1 sodium:proton antiporter [Nitrospinaceae bacterium]NIT84582.1 sodium:proton antiporter [Nitrospinaceae bacterium]NIU46768.1 sodium:proton antiporter [Nitrospinaceae bacterium]NIU96300.1 sodium:proton antiporter [Nitrospinaceae bacterium]
MQSMTTAWVGYLSLVIFLIGYALVVVEEKIHMRKSKPVIFAGCLMWFFIGLYESQNGDGSGHAH